MTQMTKEFAQHLRLLARDGTTADSAYAKNALLAAGKTWHKDVLAENKRINADRARRGLLDPAVFAPTRTTHINAKPTPNGARAIARARTNMRNKRHV